MHTAHYSVPFLDLRELDTGTVRHRYQGGWLNGAVSFESASWLPLDADWSAVSSGLAGVADTSILLQWIPSTQEVMRTAAKANMIARLRVFTYAEQYHSDAGPPAQMVLRCAVQGALQLGAHSWSREAQTLTVGLAAGFGGPYAASGGVIATTALIGSPCELGGQ